MSLWYYKTELTKIQVVQGVYLNNYINILSEHEFVKLQYKKGSWINLFFDDVTTSFHVITIRIETKKDYYANQ